MKTSSTLHLYIAAGILLAVGEFMKGTIRKITWGLAAALIVLHALTALRK
jgi:hypothetical protein